MTDEDIDTFITDFRREYMQRFLICATLYERRWYRKMGIPFPPASKPGEFPHRRTGTGQSGLVILSDTLKFTVAVHLLKKAWYMLRLEEKMHRLGSSELYAELLPQFRSILAGVGYSVLRPAHRRFA